MSATIDPSAAVVEALTAYLATALSGVCTVRRGWPESDTALDITTIPTLSVEEVPSGVEDEVATPSLLGVVADGRVDVALGPMTIAVQLDLFAATRYALDRATLSVDNALSNALPFRPHLYLTATDYDAAPFTVIRTGNRAEIDGETAQRGEWRRIWSLRAELDRRSSVTMTSITTLDVALTTS